VRPAASRVAAAAALAALLACGAPLGDARAEEALHLTWRDCWTGAAAVSQEIDACFSNAVVNRLVAGFTLSSPIDSVIAIEAVIDLVHEDPALPAWWHLESGGCREGALDASAALGGLDGCADMWAGHGFGLIQGYDIGAPRGGANQARIKAVVAVPSQNAVTLAAGTAYAAVVLTLDDRLTTGPGFCAGCGGDACLVLNSILVRRLPGGTGDVFLEVPAAGDGNRATWGPGSAANCAAVPVRSVTWGRIKAFYR